MLAVAEDADVTAERQRVLAAAGVGGLPDIISITNLRKQYDNSSKKASGWHKAGCCFSPPNALSVTLTLGQLRTAIPAASEHHSI